MSQRINFVSIASAVALVASVGAASAQEAIRYGAGLSLTGDWAPVTPGGGMQCMAEIINEGGGILGQPLEVVIRDSRSDPQLAVTLGQEYLDEGVIALTGTPASDSLIPLTQLAMEYGVTVFSAVNTQVEMFQIGDESTFMTASVPDPYNAAAAAEVAYAKGGRTALLLVSKDYATWTEMLPEWFGETFERLGGTVVGRLNHSVGTTDWSPQITEIKAMDPVPDVIHISSVNPDVGILIRQLRAAGINSMVFGSDGFDDITLADVAGGAANVDGTVFFATHGFPVEGSKLDQFYKDCTERGYEVASVFFGLGGDVMLLLKQGIELAGSTDPTAVREALYAADSLEGLTSETFVYKGGPGFPVKKVAVIGFKDGERVLEWFEVPAWVPYF
ncbi:MAG: ABC transporter substrate-binding protein [Dongiaceae bacterium]